MTKLLNYLSSNPRRAIKLVILFIAIATSAIIISNKISFQADINIFTPSQLYLNNLAKANNMQLLGNNQIMISYKEGAKSNQGNLEHNIWLKDGKNYQFSSDKVMNFLQVQGNNKFTTLIPKDDSTIVHTLGGKSVSGFDKTTDESENTFLGAKKVPVIIKFAGQTNFYQLNNNVQRRQLSLSKFRDTKSAISQLLKPGEYFKNDLLIINGATAEISKESYIKLKHDPKIVKIEYDKLLQPLLDTSVPEIRANEVWDLFDKNNNQITGIGQTIAVIDTGVDYTHPELGGCFGSSCKVIGGYDFIDEDQNPMDDVGHGTHVAATATGKGVLNGVAPDAKILAYRVCGAKIGGCPKSAIISAIQRSVDPNQDGSANDHVSVATMSLGGPGDPSDLTSSAVDNASAAGVVFTIAAGNSGPEKSTIGSPGTALSAITVAAACRNSQVGVDQSCDQPIASFSSRGPLIYNGIDYNKPDVAAPGVAICAARWDSVLPSKTCKDNKHISVSGTSMATPHVAGLAALIRQAFPDFTPEQVKMRMKNTTRDLGMGYDDQGTGMVDAKKAIPISQKVESNPQTLNITTDPTKKQYESKQSFSVRSLDETISDLDITTDINITGVSIIFSKTKLSVANKGTDEFEADVIVDNDLAEAGIVSGNIYFSEGEAKKGIIPTNIYISFTLSASPLEELDFGVVNADEPIWTSPIQQVTVTNLRVDQGQSINLSAETGLDGISMVMPESQEIQPDGSITFDVQVKVDNGKVPNDFYRGIINIETATSKLKIRYKFLKYIVLTVKDISPFQEGMPIEMQFIWVHDRTSMAYYAFMADRQVTLYLDHKGLYDIAVISQRGNEGFSRTYNILREGVAINSTVKQISVSDTEAKYLVKTIAKDLQNQDLSEKLDNNVISWSYLPLIDLPVASLDSSGGSPRLQQYFTPTSKDYKIEMVYSGGRTWLDPTHFYYVSGDAAREIYYVYNQFYGIDSNRTFIKTAKDYKVVKIVDGYNRPSGSLRPLLYYCPPFSLGCSASSGGRLRNRKSKKELMVRIKWQSIISNLPSSYYHFQAITGPHNSCTTSRCDHSFLSVMFNSAKQRTVSIPGNIPTTNKITPAENGIIFNGLGPPMWVAKLRKAGSDTTIQIDNMVPVDRVSLGKIESMICANVGTAIYRQDYSGQEYDAIKYEIRKGGVKTGEDIIPAAIDFYSNSGLFYQGQFTVDDPGQYEFVISKIPYKIKANFFNAKLQLGFDTGKIDGTPPSINKLYVYSGNRRSEVYDETTSNKIIFQADPVDGAIKSLKVSYSKDGINFLKLKEIYNNPSISVELPKIKSIAKITIKLEAYDSSDNYLSYIFELPSGRIDKTPPHGAIIINNRSSITKSKGVNTNITVSDNDIGVDKMRFSNDGKKWSGWTNYLSSINWDITSSLYGGNKKSGFKKVFAQFRDFSQNVSIPVKDWIIYNPTKKPIFSIKFHANAKGRDNSHLRDEYFTIKNNMGTYMPLKGWYIKNKKGNKYKFRIIKIASKYSLKIITGKGINVKNRIFMNRTTEFWNNTHDKLRLYSADKKLVIVKKY